MQMNDAYQGAIDGTLTSQGSTGSGHGLTFYNMTVVPLAMYLISSDGSHSGWDTQSLTFRPGFPGYLLPGAAQYGMQGGASMSQANPTLGWYWLFTNALSGAFAAVFATPPDGGDVYITDWDLLEPNDIGNVPQPDPAAGEVIPADSTRIVVGCGFAPNTSGDGSSNLVVREQLWQRLPDSYSIAPGETRQYEYAVESGMQKTTSELTTMEASINTSAGAGWGPVSASVSAALSASCTNFQQVTVTEQATSFVSETYSLAPDAPSPQMVLYWQLTDCVTVYDSNGIALSSIVSGTQPAIIGGPYTLPDPVRDPRHREVVAPWT